MKKLTAMTPARPKRFYSVAEVAELLGLSEPTVYRAIRGGEFPAVQIRKRYVVPAKVIDEMEAAAMATGSVIDTADYCLDDVA